MAPLAAIFLRGFQTETKHFIPELPAQRSDDTVSAMSDPEPSEIPESYSADTDAVLQACPSCATLLDVSDEEPFSQVHCPICGTLMNARTQLKNFTIEERVGGGGMGTVYKATDANLNRLVALKVVRREFSSDAEYLAKFETEARITASVNHPHVVKVYSFGSDHGLFYIAMELVDKGSLDDLMNLQGRVAEAQVLEVGIQIADGLRAAHQKGLIHRDVKPGNILFAGAHTAKIVDFGLALLVEHAAEERGEVWGTPYYVAPEKLNNEPEDFRSDMYSLGATLFHAVAGRPPFEAQTASMVALKHIKSKAVSLQAFAPDVASATAFVINRMMQKEPADRYQSYDELIEHLTYAHTQLLEAAGAPRQKERVVMEGKKQQQAMTWITLGLFGVLVAAGVMLYFFGGKLMTKDQGDKQKPIERLETDAQTKFQNARRQLAADDYAGAMGAFRQLATQPGAEQPLANWSSFHEGLCALLDGRVQDTNAAFKRISQLGPYSTDPNQKALATFFIDTSNAVLEPKLFNPARAKGFSPTNQQAAATLVLALKNWEMQKFDEAAELLNQFLASNPQPPFEWIAEYKPIAQKYADDYKTYKNVSDKMNAARTPAERAAALKAVQDLRSGPSLRGKMNDRLIDMERELQKKISDASISDNKRLSEQHERDVKTMESARVKIAEARLQYDFESARKVIEGSVVEDPDLKEERAVLLKKSEWLTSFKNQLIRDVNTTGYPAVLQKKNGFRLEGGVRRASAKQVEMTTPYGSVPVLWSDLTPSTLLAMGNYFATKAAASPEQAAERTWLCGVFAFESGMLEVGRTLVVQASQTRTEYQEQLKLFFQ